MGNVQYQPPNAIPDAAHRMKPPQTKQDMALKRLQYLISGIFCPLNIFGHEISLDNENANIQRYLTILADCHTLLLNLSSQVNNMRNTMAFQTINPTFKSTAAPTKKPCVSLRSIASSLALKAGIPKDDTVTMGNWFPSAVFENHYRREHLSQFDFSNTLIDIDDAIDEDDGQFFDAEDNMACD
ncbi:hypothetical protein CU097_011345 [Rhizopus azygosporus]|uniref:Uncharacterized protein n=2 Tax=Rhizopus TaxID=4842 RepID=A0A367JK71_RHIAZ|nr:hypothetical protein CU097_011345 [Rhizopus azygosporus]